jgi:hypothetical protein
MVQTFDSVLHDDQRAAQRHLDKLYGETLSYVGHKLAKCDGKYTKMLEDAKLDGERKKAVEASDPPVGGGTSDGADAGGGLGAAGGPGAQAITAGVVTVLIDGQRRARGFRE